MQARRTVLGAWFLVTLFVLQSTFSTVDLHHSSFEQTLHNDDGVEWVQFDLIDGVYSDAVGAAEEGNTTEHRTVTADTRIGLFDVNGLHLDRPVPSAWMQGRTDLRLVLIDSSVELQEVRRTINQIQGVAVREYISPSGLLVQGTPHALESAASIQGVVAQHLVPLGLLVDDAVLDVAIGIVMALFERKRKSS